MIGLRRSPNLNEEFSSWRFAAFQTDDRSTGMSDALPAMPDFEPQEPRFEISIQIVAARDYASDIITMIRIEFEYSAAMAPRFATTS
jgi:hypothetical protein